MFLCACIHGVKSEISLDPGSPDPVLPLLSHCLRSSLFQNSSNQIRNSLYVGGFPMKESVFLLAQKLDMKILMVNGLLIHMTQPTSRSIIKAIACSKPTISEH